MTTLADFQQVLDPDILKRGRGYYDAGKILQLKKMAPDFWLAMVEGSNIYQVEITIGPGNSLSSSCSCLYDQGPVCRHVASVYYALEAGLGQKPVQEKAAPRKKRKTKRDKLQQALGTLSKKELSDFLLELALEDRELAQLILVRYGAEVGSSSEALRLVRNTIRSVQNRHGYIDYWGAVQAAEEISNLLDRAEIYLEQANPHQAVPILQAIIQELIPAMSHADDSLGALSDCIQLSLDGLLMVEEELIGKDRESLFAFCLSKAPVEPFVDWDWGWDLAEIAGSLVDTPGQKKKLFSVLDQMVNRYADDDIGNEYQWELAATIKLSVINQLEGTAAVLSYLEAHSDHELMQLALARFHFQYGNPQAAKPLCEAWLARPEHDRPDLLVDFLALLFDMAEAAGDHSEQIRLAEALYRETGFLDYFDLLKELVDPQEWPAYRARYLQEMIADDRTWVDMGELYISEEMWPELLALVQEKPRLVREYHKYLDPHYPEELSAVYEGLAVLTVEEKVNRKGYRQACRYLKQMRKLGQEERVAQVLADWREVYKQRPALLDELDKAFGVG